MRTRWSILSAFVALAALGLAACGGSPPHQWRGGPVPTGQVDVYRILPGAGTVVQPGVQPGYGISANTGSSFRLVWTGQYSPSYNRFWGSIYTSGRFASITPGCVDGSCRLEGDDFLSVGTSTTGGERVDFDAFTSAGIDGFDFVVDREPVYFDLYIDGYQQPMLVAFPATDNGGAISSVRSFPFGLITQ